MSRAEDDPAPHTPLPTREFLRVIRAGSPGRFVTIPVILFGFLLAAWLFFDAALDQRQSPHTTFVALASVAALIAVIATLVSLLGYRSQTLLWFATASFGSGAALSFIGHATSFYGYGASSLPTTLKLVGGYVLVVGPPILVSVVLMSVCGWLARRAQWITPW